MIEKVRAIVKGLTRLQRAVSPEFGHAILRQHPASTFALAGIWLVINNYEDVCLCRALPTRLSIL